MALIVIEVETLVERDLAEERRQVVHRVDGDADPSYLALRHRMVGVVAHLGRQVERGRESALPGGQELAEAARWSPRAVPNPAYWRMVQSRPVYMLG